MAKTVTAKKTATKKVASVEEMLKSDPSKLRAGEWLSRISYIKVTRNAQHERDVNVMNTSNLEWSLDKQVLARECYSANQYKEVVELTRTALLEIFVNVDDSVWTANYDKVDGENRTMVGHMINVENHFGRSNVIDLEDNGKMKQVDHRTLHWLIYKGVKYQVK